MVLMKVSLIYSSYRYSNYISQSWESRPLVASAFWLKKPQLLQKAQAFLFTKHLKGLSLEAKLQKSPTKLSLYHMKQRLMILSVNN